jgi:hypothetical protein
MDNVPRMVERRASSVGMQVCKYEDNSARNGVVGEQWAGKDDAIVDMGLQKDADLELWRSPGMQARSLEPMLSRVHHTRSCAEVRKCGTGRV